MNDTYHYDVLCLQDSVCLKIFTHDKMEPVYIFLWKVTEALNLSLCLSLSLVSSNVIFIWQ